MKKPGPNIKGKMDDRGEICLFVGYAKNHAGNVYRMYNLRTKKVWLTRDVVKKIRCSGIKPLGHPGTLLFSFNISSSYSQFSHFLFLFSSMRNSAIIQFLTRCSMDKEVLWFTKG